MNRSAFGKDHAEWLFLRAFDEIVWLNPPLYRLKAANALYWE